VESPPWVTCRSHDRRIGNVGEGIGGSLAEWQRSSWFTAGCSRATPAWTWAPVGSSCRHCALLADLGVSS